MRRETGRRGGDRMRTMRTIKKYANRRLYDTHTSAYINLEGLAALIREGVEVAVVDVKTGQDLTREVLLQVVLEVLDGADFLPIGMLRRIIRATGDDPGSKAMRTQLATGLVLVSDQLDRMEELVGPFSSKGFAAWSGQQEASAPEPVPDPEEDEDADGELSALRERLEALEARLKR